MDARVKPAHDAEDAAMQSSPTLLRRMGRPLPTVIAGLDPAIHEVWPQRLRYVRLSRAESHHGCAGQARS